MHVRNGVGWCCVKSVPLARIENILQIHRTQTLPIEAQLAPLTRTPTVSPFLPPGSALSGALTQPAAACVAVLFNDATAVLKCHIGLATWGRATVVELDNIGKGTTRYLCAEGCWRALGIGRIGIEWRPCGRGDTLVFSSADGPVLDSDVPRLLKFEDPVLEDQTHTHAFIFSSEEVRRLAAKLLHCTL